MLIVCESSRRVERTVDQKIERLASAVKGGKMDVAASLQEALADPQLAKMLSDPATLQKMAAGLTGPLAADPQLVVKALSDPASLQKVTAGLRR